MGDKTGIQWTDATWNPVRGCSRVSEGCRNCYAEKVAARFCGDGMPYEGLVAIGEKGARWSGKTKVVAEHMRDPLRWTKPRLVFVNSMSDLFHESLRFEDIAEVFGVMAAASRHTFQVLTKRPKRAAEFFAWMCGRKAVWEGGRVEYHESSVESLGRWPLPNVWLGVSVEDQRTADERIPVLCGMHRETPPLPAAKRFVSYEPALGPVRFESVPGQKRVGATLPDWIIVGGESGPGSRPFDVAWARSVIRETRSPGIACFVKQLGAKPVENGNAMRLSSRKGGEMQEWPEDLRVREMPSTQPTATSATARDDL